MHGPNHLFCCGVEMEHTALALAAWSGWCSALGRHEDAAMYSERAMQRAGKVITGCLGGNDALYVVSCSKDGPALEDIEYLIEVLTITKDACERRAAKALARQEKDQQAALPAGPTTEAAAK